MFCLALRVTCAFQQRRRAPFFEGSVRFLRGRLAPSIGGGVRLLRERLAPSIGGSGNTNCAGKGLRCGRGWPLRLGAGSGTAGTVDGSDDMVLEWLWPLVRRAAATMIGCRPVKPVGCQPHEPVGCRPVGCRCFDLLIRYVVLSCRLVPVLLLLRLIILALFEVYFRCMLV